MVSCPGTGRTNGSLELLRVDLLQGVHLSVKRGAMDQCRRHSWVHTKERKGKDKETFRSVTHASKRGRIGSQNRVISKGGRSKVDGEYVDLKNMSLHE